MLAAEGLDHGSRLERLPLNGKHYLGESGVVQAQSPMRSGGVQVGAAKPANQGATWRRRH
jgi:hypothetical protein